MDTLDCIKSRHSIRNFLPNKIPEEVLYRILDAANSAPCAGNIQCWRFLIVEKEAAKKVIAKACLDQNWIATAPVIILILSDSKALKMEYGERGEKLYEIQNATLAAENLILAAWNYGIGSTYIGTTFAETKLRKEFRIPDSIKIFAVIPLGYPAEMPRPVSKVDITGLIQIGNWGRKVEENREGMEGLIFHEGAEPRLLEKGQKLGKEIGAKVKKTIKRRMSKR
jgi:nitroreductase